MSATSSSPGEAAGEVAAARGLPVQRTHTHHDQGHRPDAAVPERRAGRSSRAPTAAGRRWVAPTWAGPAVLIGLVVGQGVLWAVTPTGQALGTTFGQAVGAVSVLLMAQALVLVSTLPLVEPWFGGIDRAAIWHRRVAIAGTVLLLLHTMTAGNETPSRFGPGLGVVGMTGLAGLVLWSVLPRWRSLLPTVAHRPILALAGWRPARLVRSWLGGYGRWRDVHRLIGLFVALGAAHGFLDATVFGSGVLRWTYLGEAGVGLVFYLHHELVAPWTAARHDYEVAAVTDLGQGLTELSLRPLGRPVRFEPGQFATVYLEAKDGWHRHPFSIAGAPSDPTLRFTVKSLGDYTSRLQELVEPGMPAVVSGAHGHFDHRRGSDRQVWIAGGVGVAPFLSWLRSATECPLPANVDLFLSSDGPSPFAPEITAIAAANPALRVHLVNSRAHGRLTAERVLDVVGSAGGGPDVAGLSVFLCGPEPMLAALIGGLRAAGVPRRRVHREYFDWR